MEKLSLSDERAWCRKISAMYHAAHTALEVARAEERKFHEYMITWHSGGNVLGDPG